MTLYDIGDAKVYLIAGGGKCYTDMAAKFCRSTKSVEEIIGSEENHKLIKHIVESGHLAATEFDYYLFGIEHVSRVFEAQLIRKRMASYMISSGREKHDDFELDAVIPEKLRNIEVCKEKYVMDCGNVVGVKRDFYTIKDILELIELAYKEAVFQGVPAEEARYLLPQGGTKKIIVGMNAHSLIDWFKIRCCNRCMTETRGVANQILKICKETNPVLFANAGASCACLGYCPEGQQCEEMKGKIPILKMIKEKVRLNQETNELYIIDKE